MGRRSPYGEYPRMETAHRYEGRTLSNADAVAREARRLVGFERSYRCIDCGHEQRTWSRLSTCPDCGTPYVAAVIHRAALA